jgi:hypothetical protein
LPCAYRKSHPAVFTNATISIRQGQAVIDGQLLVIQVGGCRNAGRDHAERQDVPPLYEEGKHRRYSLLFSVNGGAFTVAKILVGSECKPPVVLGRLTLPELSWGMILFTVVMVLDIYAFGHKMRNKHFLPEAFDWRGKSVLISIGLIICLGWFLVGGPPCAH